MSHFKKSSFSNTYDILKKYIKEKESFSENARGFHSNFIVSQVTTQGGQMTLELFPGIEFKEKNKTGTIIYNGEVVISYDNTVAKKAEEVCYFAESFATLRKEGSNVVMLMARRKSLQHFLQKRRSP